ncbi:SH3 domain-containing protein [Solitalea koreensis]|uniref:SH3 domain-containing protein n=1 Tax=Solitalea koreensis TaxID=543615 RepID=A0A521BZZ2_9SPHI|nr:hypothetical protein [Solitalea koreensis]SMO52733.1 hypothetical protein SAMN06265350_10390 [Solitalea koreensis]
MKIIPKLYIIASIVLFFSKCCFSQHKIRIGEKIIQPETVNSFDLCGSWKIIHKDYVAEEERSNFIKPLEYINKSIFSTRKSQGELGYGDYVSFTDSLYLPFSVGLPSLIVNPKYRKQIIKINPEDGDYDPRLGTQKLLSIDVLCPLYLDSETQIEFSILALSSDLICIIYDNTYVYLQRVIGSFTWHKDKSGFFYANIMGSNDFKIIIPSNKKTNNSLLEVLFVDPTKKNLKYAYVENFIASDCNNGKTNILFPPKNEMVSFDSCKIPTKNIKSNILRINGGTYNPLDKWQVKWRILENPLFKGLKKIYTPKSTIYSSINPPRPTKMYLIQGNEVEVLEEKGEWIRIRFYGKKTIEGWIKRTDVTK